MASIDLIASEGGQPAGYALAGPAGAAVGPHAFLARAAIGMLVASLGYALLPGLRVRVTGDEQPRPGNRSRAG